MTSLHDELMTSVIVRKCKTCDFLATLPPLERAEWEAELALSTVSNAAVARAMIARNTPITVNSVRLHRATHP